MTDDAILLRQFIHDRSGDAFRELVRQRLDLVYAAALRQVGGDSHLAEDVAQNVFIDLARKARVLVERPNLTGWLYTSTRFAASRALRSRGRRLRHETEAHAMNEVLRANTGEVEWDELRPVLDAAMHELGETDREAILLRFFEGCSLAEVGAAIGLAENSARMRVERALEKLRERLARRGITSTAAALGIALTQQPAVTAPVGLAANVAGVSLVGAVVASGGVSAFMLGGLNFMNTKLVIGALGVITTLGLGAYWATQYQTAASAPTKMARDEIESVALREENVRLKSELALYRTKEVTQAVAREGGTSSASSAMPSQWRVLAELQQRKMIDPRITFVHPTGKLNETFAGLFELTSAETDVLQTAVDKAKRRLADLERENAVITRNDKGTVRIAIKPFADTGGAVYDELMKAFARTLGPERHSAFLTLGAEQVEKTLAYFGAVLRMVTFTYDPGKGETPYVVREELNVARGMDGEIIQNNYRSIDDAMNHIGTIAKLVPADFGPKK